MWNRHRSVSLGYKVLPNCYQRSIATIFIITTSLIWRKLLTTQSHRGSKCFKLYCRLLLESAWKVNFVKVAEFLDFGAQPETKIYTRRVSVLVFTVLCTWMSQTWRRNHTNLTKLIMWVIARCRCICKLIYPGQMICSVLPIACRLGMFGCVGCREVVLEWKSLWDWAVHYLISMEW